MEKNGQVETGTTPPADKNEQTPADKLNSDLTKKASDLAQEKLNRGE